VGAAPLGTSQVSAEQVAPTGHALPHPPQFAGSFPVPCAAHTPSQQVPRAPPASAHGSPWFTPLHAA